MKKSTNLATVPVGSSCVLDKLELSFYTLEHITEFFFTSDNPPELLRVDNIVLNCGVGNRLYLSNLCYGNFKATRGNEIDTLKGSERLIYGVVDRSSLDISQLVYIKTLLRLVADWHGVDRLKGSTVANKIRAFMFAVNFKKFPKETSNVAKVREYLNDFSSYLRELVRIHIPANKKTGQPRVGLSSSSASKTFNTIALFFTRHLKKTKSELLSGINLIKKTNGGAIVTKPLSPYQLEQEFNFYTTFFREIAKAILEHELFPKELQFTDFKQMVLPSWRYWTVKSDSPNMFPANRYCSYLINASDGSYYTQQEYERLFDIKCRVGQWNTKKRLALTTWDGNNEEFSKLRVSLINNALNAYFMHFLIITGMNDSTARDLEFSNEFTIRKDEQHFKAVKYRANNREVSFRLQSEFIDDFGLFLRLREYALGYACLEDHSNLFIRIVKRGAKPLKSETGGNSSQFKEYFNKKFPLELIGTSRNFRVSKSIWVRKQFGRDRAAYSLQHTPNTNTQSYTGADSNTTIEQLTDYFEWLNDTIISGEVTEAKVEVSTGTCATNSEPQFVEETPDAMQNCGKGEGCLFCLNFRVCADETDIRKLFSLKYVVEQCRTIAFNEEHFKVVYEPVLNRIDSLVKALSMVNPDSKKLIERVEFSVYEEEDLTPYWTRKLELLIDLGVL